jgi:D-galactarolactone isomerase
LTGLQSALPDLACDSHLHVFDPEYRLEKAGGASATVEDYRTCRDRAGLSRAVLVQPRRYGFDNVVLARAIEVLGVDRTRGVAVVAPTASDDELQALHRAGVRGVRFSLFNMANAVVDFAMVAPVAARIARLGWHLQVHWTAEQIVEHRHLLERLPVEVVFDHMARLPVDDPDRHPALDVVAGLMARGRGWVKLSGPYLMSRVGTEGGFADTAAIARALVRCDAGRVVWGSDWPHLDAPGTDYRGLLGLLEAWVEDAETRRRILVDNPAQLYGF